VTAGAATAGATRGGREIRRAEAADAEPLAALLAEMADELGAPFGGRCDAAAVRHYGFGAAPLFHAVLAERAGQALGMALYFTEFSTFRALPGVYVQDLYIRPPARATGLGRALLAAVVREAAGAWGAAYLRLSAHETNPGALAFYTKLGFRTDPGERPFWIEGPAFRKLGDLA
jgi:GNAT superfamily N-acetyltransferase